jgi:O-antigen/teichoic acid export membrane protein
MRLTKRLLSSSILSILDQGILSALNFAINLLLIRMVAKDDFGLYTQIFAGGLLVNVLLDSLIGGPLTNVASVSSDATRQQLIRHYWFRQLLIALVFSLLAAVGLYVYQAATRESYLVIAIFTCYLASNSVREYGRTVGFIHGDIVTILRQDLIYVVLVLAGLASLYFLHSTTLPLALLCISAASAISALPAIFSIRPFAGDPAIAQTADELATHHTTIMEQGKWAMVGAIVGWLTNFSYIYLSGLWISSSATADLSATRLWLMPIPLIVTALSRMARPHASRYIAENNWQALNRLTLYVVAAVELMIVVFVTALYMAYPWLSKHISGKDYGDLQSLIVWWGIYFALYSARWIGTSWLTSGGAFRTLFKLGSTTLVLVLLISVYTMPRWGTLGALIPSICAEIFELIVVWKFILPRMRANHYT